MAYSGSYWFRIEKSYRVQGMNHIECSGDEARLADCPFELSSLTTCSSGVLLVCPTQQETGTVGELQLVDSSEDNHIITGHLEVFNGIWGTVCSYFSLGIDEARVACRQLGYFGPCKSCMRKNTQSVRQEYQSLTLSTRPHPHVSSQ